MKKFIPYIFAAFWLVMIPSRLFSQSGSEPKELGLAVGGFTNFPLNPDYLTKNMSVVYVAPYIRIGRHEFSAGINIPVKSQEAYFADAKTYPRPGAIASYRFFVFNIYGRENMFLHYSFQYLRFSGTYDEKYGVSQGIYHMTEKNMYINNVIGLGYNIFFDTNERFGFYYLLDYVISQAGYHSDYESGDNDWFTNYIWNNLSNHIGLTFRLTPLKKHTPPAKDH